eukprot:Polyplicarium_translucidae@DN3316_c0_g1_i17.p1
MGEPNRSPDSPVLGRLEPETESWRGESPSGGARKLRSRFGPAMPSERQFSLNAGGIDLFWDSTMSLSIVICKWGTRPRILFQGSYPSAKFDCGAVPEVLSEILKFHHLFGSKEAPSEDPRRCVTGATEEWLLVALECEGNVWFCGATPRIIAGAPVAERTVKHILVEMYNVFRLLHGRICLASEGDSRSEDVREKEAAERPSTFAIETKSRARSQGVVAEDTVLEDDREQKMVDILNDFAPPFLRSVDVKKTAMAALAGGLQKANLHPEGYLLYQRLLDVLRQQFPAVRLCALLYSSYVLHSELRGEDMQALYSYLVSSNGVRSMLKLTRQPFGRPPTRASEPGGGSSSYGRTNRIELPLPEPAVSEPLTRQTSGKFGSFLLGPSRRGDTSDDPSDSSRSIFLPDVFLSDGSTCKLCVSLVDNFMLVLLLDSQDPKLFDAETFGLVEDLTHGKCEKEHPGLAALVPWITIRGEQEKENFPHRFAFFDPHRGVMEQSSHALDGSKTVYPALSLVGTFDPSKGNRTGMIVTRKELSQLHLLRLHCPARSSSYETVILRNSKHGWFVIRCAFGRLLYILLSEREAETIDDCQGKCQALMAQHFSGVLL